MLRRPARWPASCPIALGLATPALGLVASTAGVGAAFLVSTLVVMCAAAIAGRLLGAPAVSC